MRLLVNPKRKLFQWGPISFKLFYGSIFCEMLWLGIKREYQWTWPPCVGLHDHERAAFVLDDRVLRAVGEKFFTKYFLDAEMYRAQWKRYEDWMRRYEAVAGSLDTLHVSSFTIQKLVSIIEGFYHFNEEFWLIVHVPEIANWGGEQMLLKRLQKIDRAKANEYLEILSAPVKYSFFQEEELALLRIITPPGSSYLKRREVFEQHAHAWSWLLNSYGGNRVLTAQYFASKRRELLKNGSAESLIHKIHATRRRNIARKQELRKRLNLTKQDMWMAEQLSQSIWWQDHRKAYIWRMNYYWDIFLHEVAKRHGWAFDDLLWCWPKEILKISKGDRVDRKLVRSRKTYYVNELSEHGIRHIYGARAKRYMRSYLTPKAESATTLHGLAVSRGNGKSVQGRVTIVRDPFVDGKKMKKGDILVAAMTSPEFIVVMKKASAIVTDHGGMTSHAAIVSRELGIPCIVGTKVATQVLKRGDRVEVDVENGVVRKIG